MTEPIKFEALLPILIGGLAATYFVVRWLTRGRTKPDPWGPEIEEEIQNGDAQPLCSRCLTPHSEDCEFCENCGLPVGPYVNWSPYLYIFSLGDALLTGVTRKFVVKPLTVIGYVVLAIWQYTLFAPFFLFRFFRHLPQADTILPESGDKPPPILLK
jgi:hypothetical protein